MLDDYTRYLTRKRRAPRTIRLRVYWITRLMRKWPNPLACTIDDLEAFIDSRPWSPATQQTIVLSFRSFYRWAHETGLIPANPTFELANIRVVRSPSRIASESAIATAIEEAPLLDKAMILLGAECGLRVHEITKLHRDDRHGEWLRIVGKGGVLREVWLSPELAALLDEIEATRMRWGYYFAGKSGGHMHETTVWRHISRWLGSNPHSLRHRAGTKVWRTTGDIRVAQQFLGHARPETTAIYLHVERDDLARAGQATRIAA